MLDQQRQELEVAHKGALDAAAAATAALTRENEVLVAELQVALHTYAPKAAINSGRRMVLSLLRAAM